MTQTHPSSPQPLRLSAVPPHIHEQAMRQAIAVSRQNRFFPFGAVIVRAADRQIMAAGANNGSINPILHGEIVAINDYIAQHGNRGWEEAVLYTTGEPCPMCMSALAWGGSAGLFTAPR